jgi:large subunit ribosomal protein L27
MAHTKSQGKTNQKTTRPGKRRGVKLFGGQVVKNGNIIIRQVGSKFHSGAGTKLGRDFTIYAIKDGIVKFYQKRGKKFVSIIKA